MSEDESAATKNGAKGEEIEPGEVRLTFTRDGVLEEYLIYDHVHGKWIRHREQFGYDELGSRVSVDLKLKGGVALKTPDGKAIGEIRLKFQVPITGESLVLAPSSGGSHPEPQTRTLPDWGARYQRYLARSGSQPYVVAEVIRSRGSVTKVDLRRELKARGYSGWSGQVDRTIQLLRDFLGKVEQSGRGDRAVFKWLNGATTTGPGPASPPGSSTASDGSYLGKRITGFSLEGTRYAVKTAKDMLLQLTSLLVKQAPSKASGLFRLQGTRRQYFAEAKQQIRGVPTKVPGTSIYAETNLNRDMIVKICKDMVRVFGVPDGGFLIHTDEQA